MIESKRRREQREAELEQKSNELPPIEYYETDIESLKDTTQRSDYEYDYDDYGYEYIYLIEGC